MTLNYLKNKIIISSIEYTTTKAYIHHQETEIFAGKEKQDKGKTKIFDSNGKRYLINQAFCTENPSMNSLISSVTALSSAVFPSASLTE